MATPLTIYPVNAFASLISTATKVVDTGSGTTSSAFDNAILGTATGWSELFIKGPSQAWQSLGSPGAPSGHGGLLEVTYLEGQDIVAGNWTPSLRTKVNGATASVTADLAYRLYLYNTGTYTLIGTCTLAAQTVTSASINFVWGATSLPKMSFITGDKLYFDIWANVTSNPNTLGTAPFRSDIATSTTVGETTTQVVTPGYAPTIKPLYAPFGVPRALGATIMPQVIQPPLIYTPRALGATLLAESRTFVPRALGGVYIPDDPTLLWVPRALGGVLSQPSAVTTTYAFTDALTISESLLALTTAHPLDALTANDITLASLGSMYAEANSASDSVGGGSSGLLTVSLSTSDALLEQDTYLPIDAGAATDSLLERDSYIPIDAYSVSDIGNQQSWNIDALVASDSLLDGAAYLPLDGLTSTETPLDWDIYQPTDDNLVADDSASTMVQSSPGLTTTTYSFTEALVASDSLLRIDSTFLIEANSASDSFLQGQGNGSIESLSTSDSLLEIDGYTTLDALSASDIGNATRGFVDALVVSDTFMQSDAYVPADVQAVADSLLARESASWVDLLSVSDSFTAVAVSPPPPVVGGTFPELAGLDGKSTLIVRSGISTPLCRDGNSQLVTHATSTLKLRSGSSTLKEG